MLIAPLAALFLLSPALVQPALAQTAPTEAHLPAPKSYACPRAAKPIVIDGKLDDKAWAAAPWTTDFIDIQGVELPTPKFKTRTKMLWDDTYLYIAAELEEPNVHATLTEHDSVIFKDNDFEVFIKPLATDPGYFEFEINALNTSWDLFLNRPYRELGHPDNSWDIPGLKTAVAVQGTLNKPDDKDKSWTVEIAIPWAAYKSRLPVPSPHAGDTWRINFSRVEWTPGQPHEDNWVWTPQGLINMHIPSHWGYLHFEGSK